jgi:propanol-preferring alcohol dehydrogenase
MKAFRFHQWHRSGQLEDVPVPEPGPGEALIRIGGAGACHSDLHIMNEWTPESYPQLARWSLPMTPGHENAGWLESGEAAGLELGTPVVISPTWSCGVCRPCRLGFTNYCEAQGMGSGGLGRDGGLAEYMVAPANSLIPLRDLEPWQAAPLTDAGLTSYHAVKRCLPILTPDTTAVVIGVGGLGQMAIQFLRELCGAQIIAMARSEKSLKMAETLGAHLTITSDEQAVDELQKATSGLGAMVVIDFVGNDSTLAMAARMTRKQGQILVVGLGGGTLPFRPGSVPFGCSLVTTLGGTTGELAEVVALAEAGRVEPQIERYRLDQVIDVYEKLEKGEIAGRAVLSP